jgi:hypothetical protein
MRRAFWAVRGWPVLLGALAAVLAVTGAIGGCTRESVRVALEAQRRADQVQQAVFAQQDESLRILLFRDLVSRLEAAGRPVSEADRAALNEVWNERDLVQFWAVQNERAQALRIAGVDAKLASDQAIVDLLIKSIEARAKRVEQKVVEQVAAEAGQDMAGE